MRSAVNVELIDIKKQFGPKVLFSGLNYSIQSGDCLEISGKNGSGKSTLLKIIAGLSRPNSGTVRIHLNGKQVADINRYRLIGLVSPEVVMYNELTGIENIKFLSQVRGLAVSDAEIAQYCELVGLNHCRYSLSKSYSTGMKQRLKLTALLAIQPALWLLDEPASNLDAEGRAIVAQTIHFALEYGAAVVIATNEPWEAPYANQKIALV